MREYEGRAGFTEEFWQAPNMDLSIDKYFTKQRECQVQLADSDDPILDAAMVKQLAKHLGKAARLGRKIIKSEKREPVERTWTKAKKYFCNAIEDLEDENKAYEMEPGLQANIAAAPSQPKNKTPSKKIRCFF